MLREDNISGSSKDGPTLLVLAAGMGSRFGALKQIEPMGPSGETVLEYSIFDAIRSGFGRVVFVIRRDFEEQFRTKVSSLFEDRIAVDYAFQELDDLPEPYTLPEGRTKPWGTAHAVLAARDIVKSPFAVINADDFYGEDAFRALADFLKRVPTEIIPAKFCMVAYELGKTLSPNGTVSRGICTVDPQGCLESIREMEKIASSDDGPEALMPDGTITSLSPTTPVSMNMMGFTPMIFDMLDERFRSFLETRGHDLKAECYLPESVAHAISKGYATVEVLKTKARWMGITYAEDRAAFRTDILAKCDNGEYPHCLWPRALAST